MSLTPFGDAGDVNHQMGIGWRETLDLTELDSVQASEALSDQLFDTAWQNVQDNHMPTINPECLTAGTAGPLGITPPCQAPDYWVTYHDPYSLPQAVASPYDWNDTVPLDHTFEELTSHTFELQRNCTLNAGHCDPSPVGTADTAQLVAGRETMTPSMSISVDRRRRKRDYRSRPNTSTMPASVNVHEACDSTNTLRRSAWPRVQNRFVPIARPSISADSSRTISSTQLDSGRNSGNDGRSSSDPARPGAQSVTSVDRRIISHSGSDITHSPRMIDQKWVEYVATSDDATQDAAGWFRHIFGGFIYTADRHVASIISTKGEGLMQEHTTKPFYRSMNGRRRLPDSDMERWTHDLKEACAQSGVNIDLRVVDYSHLLNRLSSAQRKGAKTVWRVPLWSSRVQAELQLTETQRSSGDLCPAYFGSKLYPHLPVDAADEQKYRYNRSEALREAHATRERARRKRQALAVCQGGNRWAMIERDE